MATVTSSHIFSSSKYLHVHISGIASENALLAQILIHAVAAIGAPFITLDSSSMHTETPGH